MPKNITQSHALALLFMNELLASVETLGGIAEQYGFPALVNLMYLQNAILDENYIDVDRGNSVFQIVNSLPSGSVWKRYIHSTVDTLTDRQDIATQKTEELFDMYLLVMLGDVEPVLEGPFENDISRLEAARLYRKEQSGDDGLYRLTVPKGVTPIVDCFTGGEISGDELNDSFAD